MVHMTVCALCHVLRLSCAAPTDTLTRGQLDKAVGDLQRSIKDTERELASTDARLADLEHQRVALQEAATQAAQNCQVGGGWCGLQTHLDCCSGSSGCSLEMMLLQLS